MRLLIIPLVTCFFFGSSYLRAQDLHFSQYFNATLNTNPGLTGIFNGDQRFGANHKQQWFSVPVDYLTFSAYYDRNFRKDGKDNFFSGGILFNYDQAGDGKLSMGGFGLNGSYTLGLSPNVLVTGGVGVSLGTRSFKEKGLMWANQWNGEGFDPTLGSGENFDRTSFVFFDVGAGINLRFQESSRTKVDIGVGAFHLTEPQQTFYSSTDVENLPRRYAIHLLGSLKLFSALDLLAHGQYQSQGPYEETLFGGGVNIHISQKTARQIQLKLGMGVRLDDALIPFIGLRYDGLEVGVSYDINTSPFEAATDGRGGPEFSVTYIITKVRPLNQTKICRIF